MSVLIAVESSVRIDTTGKNIQKSAISFFMARSQFMFFVVRVSSPSFRYFEKNDENTPGTFFFPFFSPFFVPLVP